jgi:hypothetical protein
MSVNNNTGNVQQCGTNAALLLLAKHILSAAVDCMSAYLSLSQFLCQTFAVHVVMSITKVVAEILRLFFIVANLSIPYLRATSLEICHVTKSM